MDSCTRFQGFGHNANSAYAGMGLLGHPGIDEGCGYGTSVHSPVSGVVIATHTPAKPASDGYTAVYILVENALETFEFAIGHLSEVLVSVGQQVKAGDLIGREGNKGLVYAGDTRITLAMQRAGDKRGSHRHYQKRVVREVSRPDRGARYLAGSKGAIRSASGGYYQWAYPKNGYASCTDFTLPLFARNLSTGASGYDALLLQRALKLPIELQTGSFGPKTQAALKSFQSAHGIEPSNGYFGPVTRKFFNQRYGPLEDTGRITELATLTKEVASLSEAVEITVTLPPEARPPFFDRIALALGEILARLLKL